jgi:hypothetical protein
MWHVFIIQVMCLLYIVGFAFWRWPVVAKTCKGILNIKLLQMMEPWCLLIRLKVWQLRMSLIKILRIIYTYIQSHGSTRSFIIGCCLFRTIRINTSFWFRIFILICSWFTVISKNWRIGFWLFILTLLTVSACDVSISHFTRYIQILTCI